jgi:lipopolysaccharide transport system ATP-binding protein
MSNSDVVIRVEGLGKKYSLHHEQSESYTALRDVVARQAKAAGRLLNPFTLAGQLRKAQRQAAQEHASSEEEFWALKDVSFEIRRGERVGIIGRNGAGKSTLLKILSRITEPTTGRVEIRGRVASLLEVGTGFHPELTGRENIYLNGAILGMTQREIRSKFDEIVDFAEVEKFLDTPVKRYSSGMYVRLAFAVAAHLEPEILVVDEVLAVGDAGFQRKCLGKMNDVARQGRTVLFVSHNMQALASLCSRAIILKSGQITLSNLTLQESINNYLNLDILEDDFSTSKWHGNKGNDAIILTSLEAHGSNNLCHFNTSQPIKILLKVNILKQVTDLVVGIHLISGRGYEIGFTAQYDNAITGSPISYSPGNYIFELTIPGDTLGKGKYKIVPNIGIHNIERIIKDDISIEIDVSSVGGIGSKYLTGPGLENIFRPGWSWITSKS